VGKFATKIAEDVVGFGSSCRWVIMVGRIWPRIGLRWSVPREVLLPKRRGLRTGTSLGWARVGNY
jgi:hypothetical protein